MHTAIRHFATADFWSFYRRLPDDVREIADRCFALLKSDPRHPSLHLKKIDDLWSVGAGLHYRALGMDAPREEEGILWFWIGHHTEYDRLIRQR